MHALTYGPTEVLIAPPRCNLPGMTLFASDGSTVTAVPAPADDAPNLEIIDAETEPADDTHPPVEPAPEPDGDVVDAEVVTDLATKDEQDADDETWAHEPDWAHDELEYHGDTLAIRVPQQNALTALYQATATCSDEFAMKMATKFVKHHLSEKTRERVLDRMADPDDPEYSKVDGVWNDLLQRIGNIGGERVLKNAKALAAAKNGKAK